MDTAIPTRSGIICTFAEYAPSLSNFLTYCPARAKSIGLKLTSQAGLLSLVAILFVSIFIRNTGVYRSSAGQWHICIIMPSGLMLYLLRADALQAIGAVMNLAFYFPLVQVGKSGKAASEKSPTPISKKRPSSNRRKRPKKSGKTKKK